MKKIRNKGSVDQGNFLANHERQCLNNNKRKGTPMIQDQNKSKHPKNHHKEVLQKPRYNQCYRTHPGKWRANTKICFKYGREGHFIKDCSEYSHSPR